MWRSPQSSPTCEGEALRCSFEVQPQSAAQGASRAGKTALRTLLGHGRLGSTRISTGSTTGSQTRKSSGQPSGLTAHIAVGDRHLRRHDGRSVGGPDDAFDNRTFTLLFVATATGRAQTKNAFCEGFAEGWKTVQGGIVPICPIAPITPIGSTPFREGIKAGIRAGEQQSSGWRGGASDANAHGGFCDGFAEGWKSVKGELTIVPICPIEPITPIGSTSFREGIKAGIAKARAE